MHEESRPERRLFLSLLHKFRIASSDAFTARFWTCRGYEYSGDLKRDGRGTVLWSVLSNPYRTQVCQRAQTAESPITDQRMRFAAEA
jgi:hypothetical protein